MRHTRRRHFRPRRFRFRPRGFSERFTGPIYRGAFKLLGVPPEQRRSAYNWIAIAAVLVAGLGMGVTSLGSGGICGGISALVGGLIVGWFVVTGLRYFR
jgi:hypothetical protein